MSGTLTDSWTHNGYITQEHFSEILAQDCYNILETYLYERDMGIKNALAYDTLIKGWIRDNACTTPQIIAYYIYTSGKTDYISPITLQKLYYSGDLTYLDLSCAASNTCPAWCDHCQQKLMCSHQKKMQLRDKLFEYFYYKPDEHFTFTYRCFPEAKETKDASPSDF